jgi:hypothetical protein
MLESRALSGLDAVRSPGGTRHTVSASEMTTVDPQPLPASALLKIRGQTVRQFDIIIASLIVSCVTVADVARAEWIVRHL